MLFFPLGFFFYIDLCLKIYTWISTHEIFLRTFGFEFFLTIQFKSSKKLVACFGSVLNEFRFYCVFFEHLNLKTILRLFCLYCFIVKVKWLTRMKFPSNMARQQSLSNKNKIYFSFLNLIWSKSWRDFFPFFAPVIWCLCFESKWCFVKKFL